MKSKFLKTLFTHFGLHPSDNQYHSEKTNNILSAIDNSLTTEKIPEELKGSEALEKIFSKSKNFSTSSTVIKFKRTRTKMKFIIPLAAAAMLVAGIFSYRFFQTSDIGMNLITYSGNPIFKKHEKILNPKNKLLLKSPFNIYTGKSGTAVIGFEKTKIFVDKNSSILCRKITDKNKKLQASYILTKGRSVFIVEKERFSSFDIKTPKANINVIGTRFAVETLPDKTRVTVLKGRVRVFNNAKKDSKEITDGEGLVIEKLSIRKINDIKRDKNIRPLFKLMEFVNTKYSEKKKSNIIKKTNVIIHKKSTLKQTLKNKVIIKERLKEKVILRNGSTLTGKIISQTKDVVTLKTSYGVVKIPWSKIRNVVYKRNRK